MQKRNVYLNIVFLCLVLFISQIAFADENHYINMHVGNRASGLSGAYTALSDDPAGCYYNPAGIAFATSNRLSASMNAFSSSTKTYKSILTGSDGSSVDWKQESSSLLPNFFGIVRKLGPGMLGITYAVPDSINRRQKQSFNLTAGNLEMNINDTDKTFLVGPSYAYSFSDSLSIGATLYVYYHDMEYIQNQLLWLSNVEYELFNAYITKQEWGMKPSIGAIWEPLDKLAVGLSISNIFVTSSDYEQQTINPTTFNNDNIDSGTGIPYINYNTESYSDKTDYPLNVSLGVAYFFSPQFLMSSDIKYFGSVEDRESVYNFSIGGEYYFNEKLALRAGFFTDMANTREVKAGQKYQSEHVDIYGGSLSVSLFHRASSISFGTSYGMGNGEGQGIGNSTAIQDVEIRNLTVYISSSFSY